MIRTVYFADKSVLFTAEAPSDAAACRVLRAGADDVSRANVTKILETDNCAAIVAPDPEAAFAAFAAEFAWIEAAGGVVVDDRGAWLMIRRNGRWDLPKGHVEPGESVDACAAREIAEETGVAAEVVRPLCETLHAYWFPPTQRWELKRTHWFLLRGTAAQPTVPQSEEGISEAVWCAPAAVAGHLRDAFPTIRRVAEAMERVCRTEL